MAPSDGRLNMTGIRRAFVLASLERYVVIASTFALTIIISRLLGPAEFGISVLGNSVWAIAEATRDAGINTYLVQQESLTPEKIRTAFTITLLLTAAAVVALLLFASHLAAFYGVAGLERYVQVLTLCYAFGPFVTPIFAQLRREMAFGSVALITVAASLLNVATAVCLAMLGFGYMSLAWASLVSASTGMLLMFIARPDFTIFRPSLCEWRSVLSYGIYDWAATILYRLWTMLPYVIFGRLLSAEAVGLYQRANTLCSMPEKFLAGVSFVSLPAFAAAARDGRDLKNGYLRGLQYVTAMQWPALLLIALLAHPIVLVLLGNRWGDSAPLAQIMACASLFWFSSAFTGPVLIAGGAVRHTLTLMALSLPVSLIVITAAASHGLYAVALSTFITVPFHVFVALQLIRRQLHFRWTELASAVQKSAVVTLLSAVGPLTVVLNAGGSSNVSVPMGAVAVALSAIGWAAGLRVSGHPLMQELLRARDALLNCRVGVMLIERLAALR
jgi:O-antigen/teichoic acid export membrane protein